MRYQPYRDHQQAVRDLQQARHLIAKRRHWKSFGYGGGRADWSADGIEPVGRMCAIHAMQASQAGRDATAYLKEASPLAVLSRTMNGYVYENSVTAWNDMTFHRTVLWMFDRAIRHAQRQALKRFFGYVPSTRTMRTYEARERERLAAEARTAAQDRLREMARRIPRIDAVFVRSAPQSSPDVRELAEIDA